AAVLNAGFGCERDESRAIAKGGAEIRTVGVVWIGSRGQRLAEDRLRPLAVAQHGERRGELRLGERRREAVEARVGVVAHLPDRSPAVTRQHVERIGTRLAAALEVLRIADEILQPVERQRE